MSGLIANLPESGASVIETAAASAILHSFYTEIEKILTSIAREWDGKMPFSETWHRELLNQMAASSGTRPAVLSSGLVETLSEYLAFRHLFRGASIALMRWDKLSPLAAKVRRTYDEIRRDLESFLMFLQARANPH